MSVGNIMAVRKVFSFQTATIFTALAHYLHTGNPPPLIKWVSIICLFNNVFSIMTLDYSLIAAIPGSSMPSRYSSIAPPPVET